MKKPIKYCSITLLFLLCACLFSACAAKCSVDFIVDGEVYATVTTGGKENIVMPENPTRDGFIFDGWFWDKDTWQQPFSPMSLLNALIAVNINVYAKWVDEAALRGTQAEFDGFAQATDGTFTLTVQNDVKYFDFGSVVRVAENSKWILAVDIEGNNAVPSRITTLAEESNTFYVLVTAANSDVKLYILKIYREPLYNVIFISNGTTLTSQVIGRNSYAVAPETPAVEGYTFGGWYTSAELTTEFNFFAPITSSLTLYAKWTRNVYTVRFVSNDGISILEQKVLHGEKATYPAAPERAGYTFGGWFSNIELTTEFNFSAPITSNTVIYAKWIENYTPPLVTHTVTFNTNGGTAVQSQVVVYGGIIVFPKNPTRTGYVFDGWCENPELTSYFDRSSNITSNTTLYAKWNSEYIDLVNSILPGVYTGVDSNVQQSAGYIYMAADGIAGGKNVMAFVIYADSLKVTESNSFFPSGHPEVTMVIIIDKATNKVILSKIIESSINNVFAMPQAKLDAYTIVVIASGTVFDNFEEGLLFGSELGLPTEQDSTLGSVVTGTSYNYTGATVNGIYTGQIIRNCFISAAEYYVAHK